MIAISVTTIILLMLLILLHDGLKNKDGLFCLFCVIFLIALAVALGVMLSGALGLPS